MLTDLQSLLDSQLKLLSLTPSSPSLSLSRAPPLSLSLSLSLSLALHVLCACVIARNHANRFVLQVQGDVAKRKIYIAQKKTREKRPFCFFWSLRPRKPSNTSKYTSNCSGEREAGRLAAVFHTPGNSWPPGRRSQRLDGAGKRCGQKLQGQVAQSALLAEVRCSTAARRFKR